eukprot:g26322.t1
MQELHLSDFRSYGIAMSAPELPWPHALLLLGRLEAAGEVNVVGCTAAIRACASAGEWRRALEEMWSRRIARSAISFGAAISACEDEGLWRTGLALLDALLAAQLQPDGRIYGSVVGALRKEEREQIPVLAAAPGILALSKPSGVRTEELLLLAGLTRGVSLVSRLDAPTSGVLPLILGASGSPVACCFQAQFAGRLVDKDYVCLCEGTSLGPVGTSGEVDAPLRSVGYGQGLRRDCRAYGQGTDRAGAQTGSQVARSGKAAKTEYWIRRRYQMPDGTIGAHLELMLMHCKPLTGRTHQIRVHMASLGRPIVGDTWNAMPLKIWPTTLHPRFQPSASSFIAAASRSEMLLAAASWQRLHCPRSFWSFWSAWSSSPVTPEVGLHERVAEVKEQDETAQQRDRAAINQAQRSAQQRFEKDLLDRVQGKWTDEEDPSISYHVEGSICSVSGGPGAPRTFRNRLSVYGGELCWDAKRFWHNLNFNALPALGEEVERVEWNPGPGSPPTKQMPGQNGTHRPVEARETDFVALMDLEGGVHEEDTTAGEVLAPLEYSNVQCEPEQRLRPVVVVLLILALARLGEAQVAEVEANGSQAQAPCQGVDSNETLASWCCIHHGIACGANASNASSVASSNANSKNGSFNCTDETFSEAKQQWCCTHEQLGCEPNRTSLTEQNVSVSPSYACDGNRSQWTSMQWSWCCEQKGLACNNSNVSDTQAFDCTAEAAATWSERQRQWCCAEPGAASTSSAAVTWKRRRRRPSSVTELGCPLRRTSSAPFDCTTRDEWAPVKAQWCCWNMKVGCPEFDCEDGYSNWKMGFSERKKRYCCEHFGMACEEKCRGDPEEWSIDEKQWCCLVEHRGCLSEVEEELEATYDCSMSALSTASLQQSTWCCFEKGIGCEESLAGNQWQQAQVQVEEEDDSSFYFVLLLLILLVMLIYNRAKGSCESRNRRTWSFGPSPQGTAYGRGVYSALGSRYTPPSLPPDMRPPTRGRGYEERPGTELGAGLFRAGAGAGAAPARRKVVHVDHHHVHHHHHFHGAQNVDGLPSDASELRRHELSAEHQAEQRLEPRSVAPNTARPSRGHRQAAARRAARSRQVDFESSLTSELGRLQTSTFSTFGGAPVDLASKASCFMATSVLERERKTPPELQLQEYFELMSSLPMETRLKLSPYSAAHVRRRSCPPPLSILPAMAHEALEEGSEFLLDWQKLKKVALCESPVVPVAVQHADTLELLIVAFANEQALLETFRRKVCVLWSTSRNKLWIKGETSGELWQPHRASQAAQVRWLMWLWLS